MSSPTPPTRGSCAGYQVRSSIGFQTLRDGDDGAPLEVRHDIEEPADGELIAEWHPRAGNPFHGRLVKSASRFAFWASDAGWFIVDPQEPSVTFVAPESRLSLTAEVRMFGVPSSLIALEAGDLSIHAAAVEIDGRAVVLAGPSRYGKTTLAAACAAAGHRVLAEDMARCTFVPGQGASVYPGPAVMRLRPDVADEFASGDRIVVPERDRLFMLLGGAQRGSGAPVPLAAVLVLREGEGEPALGPIRAADAIRDLWTVTFSLPTDASHAATFQRVTDLVGSAPVFDLRRPMRLDSLSRVVALVEEAARSRTRRTRLAPEPAG
jgi:hypothetical protein